MLEHPFCGIKNYIDVLSDETFRTAFVNTIIYTITTVPGQMILGLLVAAFINSIPRFRITFRIVYYIPVITSWVIVSLVFRYIFNTSMLNYFITNVIHISTANIPWLDTRASGMFCPDSAWYLERCRLEHGCVFGRIAKCSARAV